MADIPPKKNGSTYFNYKGTFTILLLAYCDVRYQLTLVDIGQNGNQNDSGTCNDSGSYSFSAQLPRLTDNAMYCSAGFLDCEDSSGQTRPGEWRNIVAGDESALRPMGNPRGRP